MSHLPNIKLKNCVYCHSSSLTESDVINENGIISFIDSYQENCESILIVKDGAGVGKVQFCHRFCAYIERRGYG